jgi:hypothetical protein
MLSALPLKRLHKERKIAIIAMKVTVTPAMISEMLGWTT